jgi:hypothetical protein
MGMRGGGIVNRRWMSVRRGLDNILSRGLTRRIFSRKLFSRKTFNRTNSKFSNTRSVLFGRRMIRLRMKVRIWMDSTSRPPRGQRSPKPGEHGAETTIIGPGTRVWNSWILCLDERKRAVDKEADGDGDWVMDGEKS